MLVYPSPTPKYSVATSGRSFANRVVLRKSGTTSLAASSGACAKNVFLSNTYSGSSPIAPSWSFMAPMNSRSGMLSSPSPEACGMPRDVPAFTVRWPWSRRSAFFWNALASSYQRPAMLTFRLGTMTGFFW